MVDGNSHTASMPTGTTHIRRSDHTTQQRLATALAEIGFALPGSLLVRHMRCGKQTCRCKADPPQLHGPYYQWTRTAAGKTITRHLTTEQAQRYQPWFDNARRLRQLITELETLSTTIAERAEHWDPPTPRVE